MSPGKSDLTAFKQGLNLQLKTPGQSPGKHPSAESDDEPLSNRADEPKAKNCKHQATPDLVVLEDDDSTPLPGKAKSVRKKGRTQTPH